MTKWDGFSETHAVYKLCTHNGFQAELYTPSPPLHVGAYNAQRTLLYLRGPFAARNGTGRKLGE